MKKIIILFISCIFTFVLFSCSHDHSFSGEWLTEKEATCEESGVKYKICDKCDTKITDVIPKKSHNYTNETILSYPSCVNNGSKKLTCSECGDTKIETLHSTGHNPSTATCTVGSYCYNCHKDLTSPLGHSYNGGYCIRCGEKQMTHYEKLVDFILNNYYKYSDGLYKYLFDEIKDESFIYQFFLTYDKENDEFILRTFITTEKDDFHVGAGIFLNKNLDGNYIWCVSDDNYYIEGSINASTYVDGTVLSHYYSDAPSDSTSRLKKMAAYTFNILLVFYDSVLQSEGFSIKELGFSSFKIS